MKNYSEEWCSKELPTLLKQHLLDLTQNKIINTLIQYISMEWIQRVCLFDKDLEIAWIMRDEENTSNEGILILLDVLMDRFADKYFVKRIVDINSDFIAECECILKECVRKSDKKSWSLACRKYIEQNMPAIKDEVRMLDSYWVGKILGETIRKYEKEELNLSLQKHIDDYITMNLDDIVVEELSQKLLVQKEDILQKISAMLS